MATFVTRRWTSDYRDEKSTIKRCWWKGIPVILLTAIILEMHEQKI